MNKINIIHGDALDKIKTLQAGSVDLIIADPPYNLGKDYGNNSDNMDFSEYLDFSRAWLHECDRVLKDTGTIYVFMGFQFISYLYQILASDMKYKFGNWICWHYTQGMGKKKGFSPRHDDILMFHKSGSFTFNLDNIRIPQKYYRERNNMRGANPGDVWSFSHVHYCNENRQDHPTQKPEGIVERMVLASSNEQNNVLDPFAGSGTTPRVCQQLNRHSIGIELSQDYINLINTRLEQPFAGFDSIDPRMNRVPLDLRNKEIRKEYLRNHKKWFLRNHENTINSFKQEIVQAYGHDAIQEAFGELNTKQRQANIMPLFDQLEA